MTLKINNKYIKEKFGADLPQKNINALRTAMQKYGDNHWWESKDPVEIARYQVFENILMSDFSKYHEGIEKLVERPVYTHEFALNVEGLRQEDSEAIARLDGKIGALDDKVVCEREVKGIKTILDYYQKTGKPMISIVIPK
ncbi:MAG: hypothetical protein KJ623_03540 [Nanoarchaeota archaeon]|nr:hypothetical protein [Nanoarchaeota archaeon]MBU0963357.1 hypothetical protein [Nanoarchaeota archaeon]